MGEELIAETPAPIDEDAARRYLAAFAKNNTDVDTDRYVAAFQFGDSVRLADELSNLVVSGPKRATAGSVAELEAANAPTPAVGDLWVVCDGKGQPTAIIRSTDVRVGPLSSVDDQFAWDEGEGDRSRAYWLDAHTRYFTRALDALGLTIHADTIHADIAVVFERFELLHPRLG